MYNEWKKKLKPILILVEVVIWISLFFILKLKKFLIVIFVYFLGQLRERVVSDPDRVLRVFNRSVYISETQKENGQRFKKIRFVKHKSDHPAKHVRRLHINQPGAPKPRDLDKEAKQIMENLKRDEITNEFIDNLFDDLAPKYEDEKILENKFDYSDEKALFRRRIKYWLAKRNEN